MKFGESRIKLKHLNPDSQVHVLIGPNGSGKSMSLRELESEIDETYNGGHSSYSSNPFVRAFMDADAIKKITRPVISYKTHQDDALRKNIDFDIGKLMTAFRSEGERMDDSFAYWVTDDFVPFLNRYKPKEYYMILDELDSGLSFDRISLQLLQLRGIINTEEEKFNRKVHIILTANSYELLEVVQKAFDNVSVYWVPTRKEIQVDSYNKFRDLYKSRYKSLLKEIEEEN